LNQRGGEGGQKNFRKKKGSAKKMANLDRKKRNGRGGFKVIRRKNVKIEPRRDGFKKKNMRGS